MRAADLHRLARTVRAIALAATGNTGEDRVTLGELAVLEDVAHHPASTVGDVVGRTGLSQSLVSRITREMESAGIVRITTDGTDARKVRLDLAPGARELFLARADRSITAALAEAAPHLTTADLLAVEHHLAEADRLLRRPRADA